MLVYDLSSLQWTLDALLQALQRSVNYKQKASIIMLVPMAFGIAMDLPARSMSVWWAQQLTTFQKTIWSHRALCAHPLRSTCRQKIYSNHAEACM